MKKIGISYSRTNFQNYAAWFTKEELGNELELVILSFEENNVDDIYKCQGFVLTGGVDIDPCYYNGADQYPERPEAFQTDRDDFEAKVYRYAREQQLPVLGICRGMQLINVLEGGVLLQDLGAGNSIHKKITDDKQHAVNIVAGSLLHEISGQITGNVNSAHHQAIDENSLSENLQANAWSATDPSIVEGLEFKDKDNKSFLLCVQWHPERIAGKEQHPLSQKIKEEFIAAVKNSKP